MRDPRSIRPPRGRLACSFCLRAEAVVETSASDERKLISKGMRNISYSTKRSPIRSHIVLAALFGSSGKACISFAVNVSGASVTIDK